MGGTIRIVLVLALDQSWVLLPVQFRAPEEGGDFRDRIAYFFCVIGNFKIAAWQQFRFVKRFQHFVALGVGVVQELQVGKDYESHFAILSL